MADLSRDLTSAQAEIVLVRAFKAQPHAPQFTPQFSADHQQIAYVGAGQQIFWAPIRFEARRIVHLRGTDTTLVAVEPITLPMRSQVEGHLGQRLRRQPVTRGEEDKIVALGGVGRMIGCPRNRADRRLVQ